MELTQLLPSHALYPTPYPPDLRWYDPYEVLTTGSLALHLLASLAEPGPSGSPRPSRHCQGCFPPSPAFPGSDCPQLLFGRCDDQMAKVFHLRSVTRRLVAHDDPVEGCGVRITQRAVGEECGHIVRARRR